MAFTGPKTIRGFRETGARQTQGRDKINILLTTFSRSVL